MKVCAVSPFHQATTKDILCFLKNATADLVMLPGYSQSRNTPTPNAVQKILQDGVTVFVEGRGGKGKSIPYLVSKRGVKSMPKQMTFSKRPTANDIDMLCSIWTKRTFDIGSRHVTFLLCGEIVAFNPDAHLKHGRKPCPSYDILAIPSHSLMGRWYILGPKLKKLSRKSVVLYAANNDRNRSTITTDVRIYKYGRQSGKRDFENGITWYECAI